MTNKNKLSPEDARKFINDDPWNWLPGRHCSSVRKRCSSVHLGEEEGIRILRAREQAALTPVSPEQIANYANEFLAALGIPEVETPRFAFPPGLTDDELDRYLEENLYEPISASGGNRKDLVWMKFTDQGFLGVVAASADINFDIRKDGETDLGKRTVAGIIVHGLKQTWDRSFVLAFPLKSIPEDLTCSGIETGIGNYLISQDVPILDYYSHRYF
ncbi:hypothetical protein [Varibaculum prostatecancerukia]|uniref:hypothetical protein n=1 Tax=Varibaculum prostatecancerukia TaxID=2811781 RepID=UPI001C002D7E|nr:hypothetical protein [Varibaculum prostatecancerukia]